MKLIFLFIYIPVSLGLFFEKVHIMRCSLPVASMFFLPTTSSLEDFILGNKRVWGGIWAIGVDPADPLLAQENLSQLIIHLVALTFCWVMK